MAGLLDTFFGGPDQTQALGLLGVGMMNGGFGQGAGMAMQHLAGAGDRRLRQGLLQAQLEETQAQARERQLRAQREEQALELARRKREALPSLYGGGGALVGGAAVPQTEGGIPMFSRPMGVTPVQAKSPGGFDWMRALQEGYTLEEVQKMASLPDLGRPKATRQMEVDDGKGGKRIALVDDFGREVAGFAGYTAPVQVNQGDRVSFVKPAPGVSLGINMSPSERDASARGWAGHNLAQQRFAFDKAGGAEANKPPAGYRWNANRTGMEAIPGGPADLKAGAEGQKRVGEAKDVLMLLDEVDKLLPQATGSYTGAGVDAVAAGVFGASTPGAKATAQLKAIQGALVSKMPKMTGPQSDKDVLLYREMAGQVGDPTIPVATRQAAADTIRYLNEKYAGLEPGSTKPKAPEAATPKPNMRWNPQTRKLEAVK